LYIVLIKLIGHSHCWHSTVLSSFTNGQIKYISKGLQQIY